MVEHSPEFQPQYHQKKFILKNDQSKKGWGVVQMGEHLPSKDETLSSTLILPKKKKSQRTFEGHTTRP
jgi:hypothetical protein